MIDKDELKNSLTIDEVFEYVMELGGEPKMINDEMFISHTICHNPPGSGSYKLYYYENTHLFRCYTDCGTTFDIYELTCKVKKIAGQNCALPQAIRYVAAYFGYAISFEDLEESNNSLEDWGIFNRYDKHTVTNKQNIELKHFDSNILKFLPHPILSNWEMEGINRAVMEHRGICYDPTNLGIVIPHYDINGELIGIRERTLIAEDEVYGKYRPATISGKMYNHPLSFNLYNLNFSKNNISVIKKAIVFEGEKSTLLFASLFGEDNDISVACCGSSLISHQVQLLLSLGVEEIIIAFDKQFKTAGDDEFHRWVKKLTDINNKYSPFVNISFMFDKWNLLHYKSSPIDEGKEKFLKLFENRIVL